MLLFLFLVLVQLIDEAAVLRFLRIPSQTVYIPPPDGPLHAVCETDTAAAITWHVKSDGKQLDAHIYNLTAKQRTSILHLQAIKLQSVLLTTILIHRFYCRAVAVSDGNTQTSSNFGFRLGEVPSIGTEPQSSVVDEHSSVVFTCSYDKGRPLPHFAWTTDATGSATAAEWTTRFSGPSTNELVVTANVQAKHAGNYTCHLTNQFGSVSSKPAALVVRYGSIVTLTMSPSQPVINSTEVIAACTVQGFPLPTGVILSQLEGNAVEVTETVTAHDRVVYRHQFTAINKTSGQYTCKATNGIGVEAKSTTTLTVLVVPAPPRVTAVLPAQEAFTYYYVVPFDGRSPIIRPDISCTKSTKKVQRLPPPPPPPPGNLGGRRGTLTGLFPGTNYECYLYVMNVVGKSGPSASFRVKTAVGRPAIPTINALPRVTEDSIEIQWSVAYTGGMLITEYSIARRLHEHIDWTTVAFLVSRTDGMTQNGGHLKIDRLTKNTMYDFQVEAQNEKGVSRSDVISYGTACNPSPPGNPTLLSLDTRITIAFPSAEESGCGPITKYIVFDKTTNLELNTTTIATNPEDGRVTATLADLTTDQVKVIKIYAVNKAGFYSKPSQKLQIGTVTTDEAGARGANIDSAKLGPIIGILIPGCIVVIITTMLGYCYCRSKKRASFDVVGSASADETDSVPDRYSRPDQSYDCEDGRFHPGPNSGSTYAVTCKMDALSSSQESSSMDYSEVDLDAIIRIHEEDVLKAALAKVERIYDEPPLESDSSDSIPKRMSVEGAEDSLPERCTFV